MTTVLRYLVCCLLAIAFPIQGYASACMLFCAPGGHGAQSAGAQAQNNNGHGDVVTAAKISVDMADHSSCEGMDKQASGKCSACASCCHAAAITVTILVPIAQVARSALIESAMVCATGYITEGLERPPRAA